MTSASTSCQPVLKFLRRRSSDRGCSWPVAAFPQQWTPTSRRSRLSTLKILRCYGPDIQQHMLSGKHNFRAMHIWTYLSRRRRGRRVPRMSLLNGASLTYFVWVSSNVYMVFNGIFLLVYGLKKIFQSELSLRDSIMYIHIYILRTLCPLKLVQARHESIYCRWWTILLIPIATGIRQVVLPPRAHSKPSFLAFITFRNNWQV